MNYFLSIHSMQHAGAQININQLSPADWRALIAVKAEMREFEIEEMKRKK